MPEKVAFTILILATCPPTDLIVGCRFLFETDSYEVMHQRKMIVAMIPANVLSLLSPPKANVIPEQAQCTRGGRKVIGGDQEITSSNRTSVFPDPPNFDLTFRREGKVKQEESCKGELDAVRRGLKYAQNAYVRSRIHSLILTYVSTRIRHYVEELPCWPAL